MSNRETQDASAPGQNPFAELAGAWTNSQRAARLWLLDHPMTREFIDRALTYGTMALGPGRGGPRMGTVRPTRFNPEVPPVSPAERTPILGRVRPGFEAGPGARRLDAQPTPIIGQFNPGMDTPPPGRVFTPREMQTFANHNRPFARLVPREYVEPIATPPGPATVETPHMLGDVIPFRRRPQPAAPETQTGPPDTSRSHVGQLTGLSDQQMSIYLDARSRGISAQDALIIAQESPIF